MKRNSNRLRCLIFCVFFTIGFYPTQTGALNRSAGVESKCFDLRDKVNSPSLIWFLSVEKWYYPIMSKVDVYHTVENLLRHDLSNITEDDITHKSCIRWGYDPKTLHYVSRGFGGKRADYFYRPVSLGIADNKIVDGDGKATTYMTLTDNKSFVAFGVCYSTEDEMAWGLLSAVPKLPKKTERMIKNHFEEIGFNRKYFTWINYENCPEDPDDVLARERTRIGKILRDSHVALQFFYNLCLVHGMCQYLLKELITFELILIFAGTMTGLSIGIWYGVKLYRNKWQKKNV